MTATPLQAPYCYFTDDDGNPLAGGKVYSYVAGAYPTLKATYTSYTGLTPNANPVILDASGTAEIWISGSYRFDVYDANDVLIRSVDNITANDAGGFDTVYTQATATAGASISFAEGTNNGSNTVTVQSPASISSNAIVQLPATSGTLALVSGMADGRLTLTTAVPITTTDVTAATSVYYTPYKGNKIALYTGTLWVQYTFTEMTLALGTLTASRPYDVFLDYNDGAPLLVSLAWTNDTTRATALTTQDGVYVKTGDTQQRYLGTFYTTSTTTTEDSLANRYLWNYYNRVNKSMLKQDATASWNYSTAAFRQANNSTANQLNFVIGVSEDIVTAQSFSYVQSSTGTARTVITAVGLDATTGFATGALGGYNTVSSSIIQTISCTFRGFVAAGRHYLAWLEFGAGADTQTWFGSSSATGINGNILC